MQITLGFTKYFKEDFELPKKFEFVITKERENYTKEEWLKELKQLREQTRWIPVSEKMPEPQKNGDKDYSDWLEVTIVIGKNKDAYVGEAYYCFSENKWYAKRFAVGEVTAWKPLSEPYKTESEE